MLEIWKNPLMTESDRLAAASGEIDRLRGEMRVCADLFDRAVPVLHTLDGEDHDEEQSLRDLQESMERMSLHIRGVPANV